MKKAQALLDSLMGPSRDVSRKDKSNDEFKEINCCKHYLLGCCPNAMLGKKLEAIKQNPADFFISPGVMFDKPGILNPDGCTKLHSVGLRDQFKNHPDHEKFRRDFEADLQKFLEAIVKDAEGKIGHERRKRDELRRDWELHERLCDTCGMKYKLRKKDGLIQIERRGAIEWQVGDRAKCRNDDMVEWKYGIVTQTNPLLVKPDLWDEAKEFHDVHPYEDAFREDDHVEWDVHKLYVKLREKLAELQEKAKSRGPEDSIQAEAKNNDRSRSRKSRAGRSRGDRGGSRGDPGCSRGDRGGSRGDRGDRDNRGDRGDRAPDRDRPRDDSRGRGGGRDSDRPRDRDRGRDRDYDRDGPRNSRRDLPRDRDRERDRDLGSDKRREDGPRDDKRGSGRRDRD